MSKGRVLWRDRKRIFGLPISFTRYSLTRESLFVTTGILGLREEEVDLYRIQDLQLSRSLGQWIFGVGTITVYSSDRTAPKLPLRNIRRPKQVRELLHNMAEEAKRERRVRMVETDGPGYHDF